MNWDDYEIYHPGVIGPLHTLPRAEARRAFDRLMGEKSARIDMLRQLLKANGVELSGTDDGIQDLNDWPTSRPTRPTRVGSCPSGTRS